MDKSPARIVLTAFVAVAFLVFSVSAQEHKNPSASFETMQKDLGEVYESDKYNHTFIVKNVGGADLEIKRVKPS